jgi:hypothetical protein
MIERLMGASLSFEDVGVDQAGLLLQREATYSLDAYASIHPFWRPSCSPTR